jgi:hypothetical protein
MVAGEEQQPESDLRDQHGLREREQMGDDRPRLATPSVREQGERRRAPRYPEDDERDCAMRR